MSKNSNKGESQVWDFTDLSKRIYTEGFEIVELWESPEETEDPVSFYNMVGYENWCD